MPDSPHSGRPPIGLVGLVALIFLTVSGGPYGLEPAVGAVGGGGAILLIVLVPLFWCLPISLMAAELCSRLPLLGGYYRWVRHALGDFWGFQEGWWSWLFTWVDMPLYPALAGEILRQTWPLLTGRELSAQQTLTFVLGFIWMAALLNWLGAAAVSTYSVVCTVAVLAPFVPFIAVVAHRPATPAAPTPHPAGFAAWGLALSTVIWNYSGWDNVTTFAPSVDQPRRTYPRALLIGVFGVMLFYLAPVMAGYRLDPVAAHWQEGYFVQLGARALGTQVALIMSLTAMASAWAQYTSQLLYVVPLPVSMAQDGFLPGWLAIENGRAVAGRALLLCTGIYSLFAFFSFNRLLVADVLLYSAGLALEFLALWRLRRRVQDIPPPFAVPASGWLFNFICLAPMSVAFCMLALAMHEDGLFTLIAAGMLGTGPLLWFWARRYARVRAAAAVTD